MTLEFIYPWSPLKVLYHIFASNSQKNGGCKKNIFFKFFYVSNYICNLNFIQDHIKILKSIANKENLIYFESDGNKLRI